MRRRREGQAAAREGAQRLAQREGIVGLDRCGARAAMLGYAEPGQYMLHVIEVAEDALCPVRALALHQQPDLRRTPGEGAQQRAEVEDAHLVDTQRQHARRQAIAMAGERLDHRLAMRVMDQQHGRLAAGLAIGQQQAAQALQQRIGGGQRVAGRTCRADGGAGTAAGADLGGDDHRLLPRRDRAGGAEIEAARAARAAVAAVGAERGIEIDEARLVEFADQLPRGRDRALHRGGIRRIGAQIALADFMRREQRRAARQVEDHVAAAGRAVLRRPPAIGSAGGGAGHGIAIHRHLEIAEPAGGPPCATTHDGEVGGGERLDLLGAGQQHRDVERAGQFLGGGERRGVAAEDQRDALALERHQGRGGHRHGGGGDQRGHLGGGGLRLIRPAGGLADVHEGEGGGEARILGFLLEQRRLGGAGHGDGLALGECAQEAVELGLAELLRPAHLSLAAAPDGAGVEQHRIFAGADEGGGHRAPGVPRHFPNP